MQNLLSTFHIYIWEKYKENKTSAISYSSYSHYKMFDKNLYV
jgi:hypothetical protein